MKKGSTLFLKLVIYALGLAVLGLCVILLGNAFGNEQIGLYAPILIGMTVAAIPFFFALYQALLLLRYIDNNTAFSGSSVRAIKTIEYCALTISTLYAAEMPFIIYVAEKYDSPGVVAIGLVCIFAPLVVGVFAAVLQRLFQHAIDIKSENDLTV